jgi:hypothetical protein
VKEILPYKTEVIEGDPIQIGQRQLIPVAKMRSVIRRQVTFGTEASNGRGGGLVWLQPTAVIERRLDGTEERIPIADETGAAIQRMLIGALALPILYLAIVVLMFVWRHRSTKRQSG